MAKQEAHEEKSKMNPILWFFFAIVIPIVVAIVITVIVLTIAGVDVAGWAKEKGAKIPVVSSLVSDSEDKKAEPKNNLQVSESVKAKDAQINKLKDQVRELEASVDDLEQQVVKEKNKQKSSENAQNTNQPGTTGQTSAATGQAGSQVGNANPQVKKMAGSFRKMDSKQAAKIVEDLPNDMAIELLGELSTETRGQVLQEMDAKQAAKLTAQFLKSKDAQ